jgi:PAS domain S-box-containing protein
MNLLDMRTIVFSYVVMNIICVWFVVLLWRQSRNRFAGIAFLVIDFIFQAAALILIVLRVAVPDWMSMVLSNTLVVSGAILGFMGLERFVGKKGPQIHNYLLVALFIVIHGYFALVQPSLVARNLNLAVALLLVCVQSVWLLWHRVEPGLRSLTFGVGLVFFLYCLVSVVRILQFFIGAHGENNYFQSGLFEALVLVSYQMLFLLLTYSLVLMVNKRLLMQIGTQEEKFAKAFHSAPYALTFTRPSDGKIVEVNETFFSITGYDRTEIMGKKTIDLHLWERDEDRTTVVDTLTRTGCVRGMEMPFRKKNGETITGLFSAEVITIDGEKNILSSIGDITERKQAEEALRKSEERFRSMFREHVAIMLLIDSETGAIHDANAAAAQFYGYSTERLCQMTIQDINILNAEEIARQRTLAFEGKRNYFIFPHRLAGGEIKTVEVHTSPIAILDKTFLFSIVHDITERKRAEEALRQQTEELRAKNADLELFNSAATGRELRMIELKQEINKLCRRLGEPPRHATGQLETDSVPGAGPAPALPGGGGA